MGPSGGSGRECGGTQGGRAPPCRRFFVRQADVYAIIETGGHQYKVQPGDLIRIEVPELEEGQQTVEFDRVLLVGDGEEVRIGRPVVEGATVTARIKDEIKGPKIHIHKMRRRKGYRRKLGHRQRYLEVTVDTIAV